MMNSDGGRGGTRTAKIKQERRYKDKKEEEKKKEKRKEKESPKYKFLNENRTL
jgi:hypothetical protein